MTKNQSKQLGQKISEYSFLYHTCNAEDKNVQALRYGYLNGMCKAAELAGMPDDEIEACKQIGLDRATPSQYSK